MKRALMALAVITATSVVGAGHARPDQASPVRPTYDPALTPALAQKLDPVIDTMWSNFDAAAAMGHVEFVSQFWRLPGNAGFDASLDRVRARLMTPGIISPATDKMIPGVISVDSYPGSGHAWDYSIGTLAIVRDGQPDEAVMSKPRERWAVCINSFSTAEGGVVARLVDVGNGAQDADYANKDVKGAVVIGDADIGNLWRRAVMARGAIGVVSTTLPKYLNPNPPGAPATPRETWDILQWGSVPYDDATKGFGFKATPHAAATLRKALASRATNVRVTIKSTFTNNPTRTLIAEIPGRVLPDERVVMAVHVQEPGANDNASGVATLTELVAALMKGIRDGKIPPPARTLTFLWVDEIGGSRQWLRDHAAEAKNVKYMFSMDMVGEDVKKTGGTFLIERWPDPGAIFDRPWDPHTEWGRGNVRAEQLKGDLLNDIHLAICLRVARKAAWDVHTNPYEGGSDHTVFGQAGIPSVLDWHFTDRYYHTNMDTADKVSGPEMRNVATAVAATAWLLASADEAMATSVAEVVSNAGQARVKVEDVEGAKLAAAAADPAAAGRTQDQIVQAWRKWYSEAVRSASRLIVGAPSDAFNKRLDTLASPFSGTPR